MYNKTESFKQQQTKSLLGRKRCKAKTKETPIIAAFTFAILYILPLKFA